MFFYPDALEYSKCSNQQVECEELTIPTKDGAVLSAWYLKQGGFSRRLIIHFHGNAQNLSAHIRYVSWLPKVGFDVLTFDYRGYGKTPGTPERRQMIEDGKDVIRYVTQRYKAEIFVFAQSLGGAIATASLAEENNPNVRAFIIDSTFANYRRIAQRKLGGFWLTWPFQYPLSWLVNDSFSPEEYIDRIKVPVLIVHGTHDKIVPFIEGKLLYEATNGTADFWELEQADHTALFAKPDSEVALDAINFMCSKSKLKSPCGKKQIKKSSN